MYMNVDVECGWIWLMYLYLYVLSLSPISYLYLYPDLYMYQGAMYLAPYETAHCSADRAMDRATRAAKIAEIWKQLHWLEEHTVLPYLAGRFIILQNSYRHLCIYLGLYLCLCMSMSMSLSLCYLSYSLPC